MIMAYRKPSKYQWKLTIAAASICQYNYIVFTELQRQVLIIDMPEYIRETYYWMVLVDDLAKIRLIYQRFLIYGMQYYISIY